MIIEFHGDNYTFCPLKIQNLKCFEGELIDPKEMPLPFQPLNLTLSEVNSSSYKVILELYNASPPPHTHTHFEEKWDLVWEGKSMYNKEILYLYTLIFNLPKNKKLYNFLTIGPFVIQKVKFIKKIRF